MKRLLPLLLLTSCAATGRDVRAFTPEASASYEADLARSEQIETALTAAKADLEAAKLTPEAEDDLAAEASIQSLAEEYEQVSDRLDAAEGAALQRKFGPIASIVNMLTPTLPGLGSLGLGALALWPSSRRRKRYGAALKGIKSGNVLVAVSELLKAIGLSHSTPESAKAAEQTTPQT